jgi:hypothetical protein
VLDGFFVIFTEIYDAGLRFSELATARPIKEARSGTYYGAMHGVRLLAADYGEV